MERQISAQNCELSVDIVRPNQYTFYEYKVRAGRHTGLPEHMSLSPLTNEVPQRSPLFPSRPSRLARKSLDKFISVPLGVPDVSAVT